jgi:hypothetical protein
LPDFEIGVFSLAAEMRLAKFPSARALKFQLAALRGRFDSGKELAIHTRCR